MKNENLKLNGSGYKDLTAYEGMKPVVESEKRANKLIKSIKIMSDLAGFDVVGRIQIKDKKSGREYK